MAYVLLKYLHVLLAIVAIGFNVSYGIWLSRAAREPEHALHVLRGIKLLDDRFANPAYGLLLVTGIALVLIGNLSFSMFWISVAIALYVLLVVVAVALYSPTLKRQVRMLEANEGGTAAYASVRRRATFVGILLAVIVLSIEFLMVAKPQP
jgi:uncharacterized membrane protein